MRTPHEALREIAEFDRPFRVVAGNDYALHEPGLYAPEVYHVEGEQHPKDVDVVSDEWSTFSVGYTGQYSYNGAVMHASEFLGGRLADDILAEPGIYVVTVVAVLPDDEDEDPEPAGWTVLRRKDTCPLETSYGGPGPIRFCTNLSYTGPRTGPRKDFGEGWCEEHLIEWGWLPPKEDRA